MNIYKLANESQVALPVLPLVSVVMATYNGSLYLAQQIESVIAQSYPNFEIIIVDDCSTDNTIEILASFRQKIHGIKVFRNEKNMGYIKNFEKGCLLAAGEYIALCDQDDYWHPDKIKNMQAAIGNFSMIYCNSILCDESLKPIGKTIADRVNCRDFNSCLQQAIYCRIYGHATLIKKSFLLKAVPFLQIIPHDWWLCYVATFHGGIKYLPEQLASYRQHSTNIFGAVGGKARKYNKADKAEKKQKERELIRKRVNTFYDVCPDDLIKEKEVLNKLRKTYADFSLSNNFQRMFLFLRYRDQFLASKKHSALRRFFFSIKMFAMIK